MSSDSDSDEDVQMKQFLEAADTTLLNNSMFQQGIAAKNISNTVEALQKDLPKSQRYIDEDNENSGSDFNLPESMQKHLAKKLTEILKQHYEFSEVNISENTSKIKTEFKNGVKLLKGDNCCINSYEDFEYEIRGPEKKPVIKRRIVDKQAEHNVESKDIFKLVAVDGNYILTGAEIKMWSKKKERKDKVFHYKLASSGVCHAKDEINEFTELRLKNKWNENKIRKFKKI